MTMGYNNFMKLGGKMGMLKKKKSVSIALAFALSIIFLLSSCAKKQVRVEEGVKPPAREGGKASEGRPDVPREGSSAALAKAEAAREQRIREMEAARKLRMEIQAFESDSVYFDFDKSNLKPEARAALAKKAAWLRANQAFDLRIEGHADERGTNEYNLALGERRANAAWKFLNALGISGGRLSTISYGEERPADPGSNDFAWEKNRRDEFKLLK